MLARLYVARHVHADPQRLHSALRHVDGFAEGPAVPVRAAGVEAVEPPGDLALELYIHRCKVRPRRPNADLEHVELIPLRLAVEFLAGIGFYPAQWKFIRHAYGETAVLGN